MKGFAVFGDWHSTTRWAVQVLNRDDVAQFSDVYHVGDFGLWTFHPQDLNNHHYHYLELVNGSLENSGSKLHVILGNHENYTMLQSDYVRTTDSGEQYFDMFPNILFWPRVHTHVNPATGLTIVGVGGAGSVDKQHRVAGVSWWAEEEITLADVEQLKTAHPEGGEGVKVADILITHDAPAGSPTVLPRDSFTSASPEVVQYCERQRFLLRDVIDWVKPTYAFHGHWHVHRIGKLNGVGFDGGDYTTTVVALNMEYTDEGNIAILTLNDDGSESEKGGFSLTIPENPYTI